MFRLLLAQANQKIVVFSTLLFLQYLIITLLKQLSIITMKNILPIIFIILIPYCKSNYKVTSKDIASSSITLGLQYTGTDDHYVKKSSPIIKQLTFVLSCYAFSDFSFKIIDPNNKRFQVPQQGVFPIDPMTNFSHPINQSAFRFQYTQQPFEFKIVRKLNNATLFSTYGHEMIYSDYYLQIGTEVDSDYTYGLGQRFNANFRLKQGKWTIFTRDRGTTIDYGKGQQTYGYYPFYLQRQNNNFFHINYFRSSNAMDVIKEKKNNKVHLTYKVIGGVLDFRFFIGEQNPELTIQKFHQYIGRSAIPPFWSLGFHQCRWGYQNVGVLQNVLQKYKQNNVPLDTIWSDIDYMDEFEDFTVDQQNFPLDRLKQITDNYHYVVIVDAGIKVNDGIAYTEGKKRGVFIKDANGSQYIGSVWPGATTFVDFFHPDSAAYWGEMLEILYKKVKFSGIWLDMNQYANFCNGPCQRAKQPSVFDYSKDIPYNPGSDPIEQKAIPLNTTHYGGIKQANVHIFAGFLQTHATNLYLKSKNMRPFIITRASTLGSNKYGFHWTGDNSGDFQFLKGSIADNFLNQLWGFQIVGPDICGFDLNSYEQLCSRWFQLGSLYTFARNHNVIGARSQQPYAFEFGQKVLDSARTNLKLRYSLLKHYYSILINKKGLGTVFRPLFLSFPQDSNNYVDEISNTQFLIGENLMSAPIVTLVQSLSNTRLVYFSTVNWFDFHTGQLYRPGTSRIFNKLADKVPLFLREGTLVLTQQTHKVTKTNQLDNRFRIVAGLKHNSQRSNQPSQLYEARGVHVSLDDYSDDAKIDSCLTQDCNYVFNLVLNCTANLKTLSINVAYQGGANLNGLMVIDEVTIYYQGYSITNKLSPAMEIRGSQNLTIQLVQQNRHKTVLVIVSLILVTVGLRSVIRRRKHQGREMIASNASSEHDLQIIKQ